MIYILGGASRSGKTQLTRRAVKEKGVPYFPLDALFLGLKKGAPELGVNHDNTFRERPLKMWPVVKPVVNFFAEEEDDFVIEGDSLLPSQVHELINEGKSIRACFVGYVEINKEEKLSLVRKHHQGEKDWTKDIPDEQMIEMIDEMIEFSKYLKKECGKYDIAYFDISNDFEKTHQEIFKYLFD